MSSTAPHRARLDGVAKRLTAGWFYRVFDKLSDFPIPADTGDFRLMDREVVEAVRRLPERNRFNKGLFAWVGFRQIGVPYVRTGARRGEFLVGLARALEACL